MSVRIIFNRFMKTNKLRVSIFNTVVEVEEVNSSCLNFGRKYFYNNSTLPSIIV